LNPNEQENLPPNQNRKKSKWRWLLSYTGTILSICYAILAIIATIADQQRYYQIRGGGGCVISCFYGLGTIVMTLPAFIIGAMLGMEELFFLHWEQVGILIGFTALLVYLLGTGLEKLGCYLIRRFRSSRVKPKRSR